MNPEKVKIVCYLSRPIYERLRLLTLDPARNRATYGAVSAVIEKALERFINDLPTLRQGKGEKGETGQ